MGKFAAYADTEWLFDVTADTAGEAMAKAKARDPQVTQVELVSDTDGPGRAA